MADVLCHLREVGLLPGAIFDVGAAFGTFTRSAQGIFPSARCVMIEPLREYGAELEQTVAALPRAVLASAAAAQTPGFITMHVHDDLYGSSAYLECEDSGVNGETREVEAVTLNELAAVLDLAPPFLLKLDVQGAELDVLRGADRVLAGTGAVLMELSFFEFFRGGPQFAEVVAFMQERGFVPYEVFGFQYRPLDGAMSQVDMVFVKANGIFRRHHHYATAEQRREQTRQIREAIDHRAARNGSRAGEPSSSGWDQEQQAPPSQDGVDATGVPELQQA